MPIGTSLGQGIALQGILPQQDTSLLKYGLESQRIQRDKKQREKQAEQEKYQGELDKIQISGIHPLYSQDISLKAAKLMDIAKQARERNPNGNWNNDRELQNALITYKTDVNDAKMASKAIVDDINDIQQNPGKYNGKTTDDWAVLQESLAKNDPSIYEAYTKKVGKPFLYNGGQQFFEKSPVAKPITWYTETVKAGQDIGTETFTNEKGDVTTTNAAPSKERIEGAWIGYKTTPQYQAGIQNFIGQGKTPEEADKIVRGVFESPFKTSSKTTLDEGNKGGSLSGNTYSKGDWSYTWDGKNRLQLQNVKSETENKFYETVVDGKKVKIKPLAVLYSGGKYLEVAQEDKVPVWEDENGNPKYEIQENIRKIPFRDVDAKLLGITQTPINEVESLLGLNKGQVEGTKTVKPTTNASGKITITKDELAKKAAAAGYTYDDYYQVVKNKIILK